MDQQDARRHPNSPLMRGLMIREQMIKDILKDRRDLLQVIELVVEPKEILITHVPPYGILDESTSHDIRSPIGSKRLLKLVTGEKTETPCLRPRP